LALQIAMPHELLVFGPSDGGNQDRWPWLRGISAGWRSARRAL